MKIRLVGQGDKRTVPLSPQELIWGRGKKMKIRLVGQGDKRTVPLSPKKTGEGIECRSKYFIRRIYI